jgi:hypothetical protein
MKTSFGQKMRPEFTIGAWREFSARHAFPQIEHQKAETEALGARLQDANTEGQDRGGFLAGVVEDALKAKATIGKPVKPVTLSEEMDDGIPDFGIRK